MTLLPSESVTVMAESDTAWLTMPVSSLSVLPMTLTLPNRTPGATRSWKYQFVPKNAATSSTSSAPMMLNAMIMPRFGFFVLAADTPLPSAASSAGFMATAAKATVATSSAAGRCGTKDEVAGAAGCGSGAASSSSSANGSKA